MGYLLSQSVVLSILFTFQIQCSPTCPLSLNWAPGYLKRGVFTTFVNHANCASWSTRKSFLNEPTGRSHIKLAKGIPFAFICGACYTPYSYNNLTATMDGGSLTLEPLIGDVQAKKKYEHRINNYVVCLLSYGFTTPLKRDGEITCHLNIGARTTDERITFDVWDVPTERVGEEVEVEADEDGKARLECPDAEVPDKKDLIRIWYLPSESSATDESVPKIAVPSLDKVISFRHRGGSKATKVACAVYDMSGPEKVWIKEYKVRGRPESQPSRKAEWGVGGEEIEDEETKGGRSRLQNVLIIGAGVLIGGAVIAGVLVCLSFGFCSRRRNREEEVDHNGGEDPLERSPLKRYEIEDNGNRDQKFYS